MGQISHRNGLSKEHLIAKKSMNSYKRSDLSTHERLLKHFGTLLIEKKIKRDEHANLKEKGKPFGWKKALSVFLRSSALTETHFINSSGCDIH